MYRISHHACSEGQEQSAQSSDTAASEASDDDESEANSSSSSSAADSSGEEDSDKGHADLDVSLPLPPGNVRTCFKAWCIKLNLGFLILTLGILGFLISNLTQ